MKSFNQGCCYFFHGPTKIIILVDSLLITMYIFTFMFLVCTLDISYPQPNDMSFPQPYHEFVHKSVHKLKMFNKNISHILFFPLHQAYGETGVTGNSSTTWCKRCAACFIISVAVFVILGILFSVISSF